MKAMMPPARVRASIAEAKILRIVPSYGVRGFDALIQLEAMIAVPMISGIRDTIGPGELLPVGVLNDECGADVLDRPGRREAAITAARWFSPQARLGVRAKGDSRSSVGLLPQKQICRSNGVRAAAKSFPHANDPAP